MGGERESIVELVEQNRPDRKERLIKALFGVTPAPGVFRPTEDRRSFVHPKYRVSEREFADILDIVKVDTVERWADEMAEGGEDTVQECWHEIWSAVHSFLMAQMGVSGTEANEHLALLHDIFRERIARARDAG
jgi:hypothetical protein